jgi:hypothetical protein
MSVPGWYELLLLSLAAWRVFHLLAEDDILDRPRRYVTRLGDAQQDDKGVWKNIPADYRIGFANWLACPYCFGFWVGLGWFGAWQVWGHETLVAASLFSLSALVVAAHKFLSSPAI